MGNGADSRILFQNVGRIIRRAVIVLNADFEIIGETKFPGKKYFYKKSFVGREGLYISENNLENQQFDENKLVFTCFKIKNASPNK